MEWRTRGFSTPTLFLASSEVLDAARIARAIEFTRFPASPGADDRENEEGSLLRAADLIGQLGDPQLFAAG